jgi:hypothetical protein
MAKKIIIKRIVAKNGEVRYYQNGKRITAKKGASKFIKQNPTAKPLSDREKRSQKALKNYQKGWKFKGNSIQQVYVELLEKFGVISTKNIPNNDLSTLKTATGKPLFNSFEEIKKFIDDKAKRDPLAFQFCVEKGLPNYRGRDFDSFANNKLTNIVDIVDLLDSQSYKNYTLSVIDESGDEQRGRVKGLLALRDFEIRVGSQIQKLVPNSAFMRFCYDYKVDFKNRTITIDLTDLKPGDSKNEKNIEDYVNESQGTGAKQKLFIDDKYQDVEIEIDFS